MVNPVDRPTATAGSLSDVSADSEPQTNPIAIWALGTSLVFGSVFAVLFGHIALHQIHRTKQRGTWMAIVGVTLGYVEIVLLIPWVIWIINLSTYVNSLE